jgi:hypothetical protein
MSGGARWDWRLVACMGAAHDPRCHRSGLTPVAKLRSWKRQAAKPSSIGAAAAAAAALKAAHVDKRRRRLALYRCETGVQCPPCREFRNQTIVSDSTPNPTLPQESEARLVDSLRGEVSAAEARADEERRGAGSARAAAAAREAQLQAGLQEAAASVAALQRGLEVGLCSGDTMSYKRC